MPSILLLSKTEVKAENVALHITQDALENGTLKQAAIDSVHYYLEDTKNKVQCIQVLSPYDGVDFTRSKVLYTATRKNS
jgi:hypothetical protein